VGIGNTLVNTWRVKRAGDDQAFPLYRVAYELKKGG
jgi:hypothetical protein